MGGPEAHSASASESSHTASSAAPATLPGSQPAPERWLDVFRTVQEQHERQMREQQRQHEDQLAALGRLIQSQTDAALLAPPSPSTGLTAGASPSQRSRSLPGSPRRPAQPSPATVARDSALAPSPAPHPCSECAALRRAMARLEATNAQLREQSSESAQLPAEYLRQIDAEQLRIKELLQNAVDDNARLRAALRDTERKQKRAEQSARDVFELQRNAQDVMQELAAEYRQLEQKCEALERSLESTRSGESREIGRLKQRISEEEQAHAREQLVLQQRLEALDKKHRATVENYEERLQKAEEANARLRDERNKLSRKLEILPQQWMVQRDTSVLSSTSAASRRDPNAETDFNIFTGEPRMDGDSTLTAEEIRRHRGTPSTRMAWQAPSQTSPAPAESSMYMRGSPSPDFSAEALRNSRDGPPPPSRIARRVGNLPPRNTLAELAYDPRDAGSISYGGASGPAAYRRSYSMAPPFATDRRS
eukprot:m.310344 g.310344  ORF g.310344 m.310344 type:complete len:480 (-) comp24976_c0_seq1:107-1546(-)